MIFAIFLPIFNSFHGRLSISYFFHPFMYFVIIFMGFHGLYQLPVVSVIVIIFNFVVCNCGGPVRPPNPSFFFQGHPCMPQQTSITSSPCLQETMGIRIIQFAKLGGLCFSQPLAFHQGCPCFTMFIIFAHVMSLYMIFR